MSGIKDQEKLEEVRKRLYERGVQRPASQFHNLVRTVEPVRTSWQEPPKPVAIPVPSAQPVEEVPAIQEIMATQKRKKGYRVKILLAGLSFFMLAIVISSFFMLFGGGGISGENIAISATGPFTIGGGEELQMQVAITNDNAVPIESATLIVEYPKGTLSSTEEGKSLSVERLSLQTVKRGETINVPMRAKVFGEENEEKIVKVSVEYRVEGSNATFFKEAEPLRFKISSSPVVVRVEAVQKISSGQETEIAITVVSNSPTPLSEVLVKAEYPAGFDFSKSLPSPTHSQNMWLIKDLQPEKESKIVITGIVIGKESDVSAINFTVGVPNERDPQSLASVFVTAKTEFKIEQPFLDITMKVDSSEAAEIAVEPGKRSNVTIELENTLESTLHDMSVEVNLSGNAFSVFEVSPSGGYFDPSKNTIVWDRSNTGVLEQTPPGEKERLSFTIEANGAVSVTPQVNISVNAKARRISENNVSEELVGTAKRTIKVISTPRIVGVVSHNNGLFTDTGPIPPVSDIATTYTVSMVIDNGSNDITGAMVTASLPAYVTWLNKVQGTGDITYNPTARTLQWNAGSIAANGQTYVSFQVSLLPRVLQVGTIPTLVNEQRLEATDRFTTTKVRDTNDAITTMLKTEGGTDEKSGVVRASGSQ